MLIMIKRITSQMLLATLPLANVPLARIIGIRSYSYWNTNPIATYDFSYNNLLLLCIALYNSVLADLDNYHSYKGLLRRD